MEQIHEGKVVKAGGGGHTGLWPVFLGNGSQRRLGGKELQAEGPEASPRSLLTRQKQVW